MGMTSVCYIDRYRQLIRSKELAKKGEIRVSLGIFGYCGVKLGRMETELRSFLTSVRQAIPEVISLGNRKLSVTAKSLGTS